MGGEGNALKIGLFLMAGTMALSGVPERPPLDHAASVAQPARDFPRPAVVILWGTWCAPCAAELRRIPSLQAAARPLPIVTLAIDPPAKAAKGIKAAGLSDTNAFADNRDPGTVLGEWGGGGAILPLAVAIDRRGRVCGSKRGLLGTDQLREWSRVCSR